MPKNVTPNPANGPVHPSEPPIGWKEVILIVKKLAERMSEEALVIVAILAFKAFMDWEGRSGWVVDLMALSALWGYLTMRLFGRFLVR